MIWEYWANLNLKIKCQACWMPETWPKKWSLSMEENVVSMRALRRIFRYNVNRDPNGCRKVAWHVQVYQPCLNCVIVDEEARWESTLLSIDGMSVSLLVIPYLGRKAGWSRFAAWNHGWWSHALVPYSTLKSFDERGGKKVNAQLHFIPQMVSISMTSLASTSIHSDTCEA